MSVRVMPVKCAFDLGSIKCPMCKKPLYAPDSLEPVACEHLLGWLSDGCLSYVGKESTGLSKALFDNDQAPKPVSDRLAFLRHFNGRHGIRAIAFQRASLGEYVPPEELMVYAVHSRAPRKPKQISHK